jgi:hypothetical protein
MLCPFSISSSVCFSLLFSSLSLLFFSPSSSCLCVSCSCSLVNFVPLVSNVGLMECDRCDSWLDEGPFEVIGDQHGLLGGPRRARLKHASGQCVPLFADFKFFLCGVFLPPNIPREELVRLCRAAGASMLAYVPHLFPRQTPRRSACPCSAFFCSLYFFSLCHCWLLLLLLHLFFCHVRSHLCELS